MTPAPPKGRGAKVGTSGGRRPDPRPARTRSALIAAAQQILARDARADVSIQEITELAGVGQGSFYNHFESKDELFDEAILALLEAHGDALERLTADVDDPLEVYAIGLRQTGRLASTMPMVRRALVNTGLRYVTASVGLAPRALRDLQAAAAAGRVRIADARLTQAMVGGMILGLLQYLDTAPDVDPGVSADDVALRALLAVGVTPTEAAEIVSRPLPSPE